MAISILEKICHQTVLFLWEFPCSEKTTFTFSLKLGPDLGSGVLELSSNVNMIARISKIQNNAFDFRIYNMKYLFLF